MIIKTSLLALGLTHWGLDAQALSQKPSPEPSQLAEVIEASKVKVIEFNTPKGLKGWLVETKDIPVLSLSICFKNAGSKTVPKDKIGLTSFLEGILSEGCGPYDSAAFKKLLIEKNINFYINSSSDTFEIGFYAPKATVKEAFHILKLILTQPRFDPLPFQRVKQQLLTMLNQALHSENAVGNDLMNRRAFAVHPYSQSIVDTLEGIKNLTPDSFRHFIKDHFTKDQIIITAAGGLDPTTLSDLLDQTLNDLPEKASHLPLQDIETISPGTILVEAMDIPQSSIIFYQPGIARQDPDFYAAFILNKILGEGAFDSRLWDEVREKRGLVYGISTAISWLAHTNYIMGITATRNENVSQVVEIIKKEWTKVRDYGVTAEEVEFIKNKAIGSYPLAFGSTYQIVRLLQTYQLDKLGPDFINERNGKLAAVTLEDVNRVAKKLLIPEKLTFIIVGKPEGYKQGEQ